MTRFAVCLSLAFLLLASPSAHADRRAYGETYEAVTAARGELDVELWHSFATDGEVMSGPPAYGHRTMLELEYGLTESWDLAVYNLFDVVRDDLGSYDASYAGFKLETRLRLSLPGEWPVDPVLYLEYQHLLQGDATDKLELKVIVAHDFGPWNVAANLAVEVERLAGSGDLNPELEYALGVSRELGTPAFKLGVEAFGKLERPEADLESFLWVGPAVSWATTMEGRLHGVWLTVAAGRGVTSVSDAFYARAILGFQL